MKFELSDWDKRKALLAPVLEAAAVDGLVARDQIDRLAGFLLGRGITVSALPAAPASGLDADRFADEGNVVEESEAPRFVRGFHDILITIGIIVGLFGLFGLFTVYAVIPAIIVLAEIVVRRQRLALPAVVLAIALCLAMAFATAPISDLLDTDAQDDWWPVIAFFSVGISAALYYWRYRVPIALAIMAVSLYGTVVLAATLAVSVLSNDTLVFMSHPWLMSFFIGVFAIFVFGTALSYDFSDRERRTRRSDVAFWMHLAAAPALLYTVLAAIYRTDAWFSATTTLSQAGLIVLAIAVLMLIGILLDRRAFVTSGLLSLGYALQILLKEGGIEQFAQSFDTQFSLIMLAIGAIVLGLGIGWQWLRRVVVLSLPADWQAILPPVKG